MALNYVTLVCDLGDGQGNYLVRGLTATLAPTAVLTDSTDHLIATTEPIIVAFYPGVSPPQVKLIATDNANISPAGWAWTITPPAGSGVAAFSFYLPFSGGSTQYLSALAPVVSPQSFVPAVGAPIYSVPGPTGVTATDTVTIQAAITRMTNAGGNGTLQFQDGTYQVDSNALVIRNCSNFAVRGTSSTVITQAPNRTGNVTNITGDLFVIADCTDFRVEGITLDGLRDTLSPITSLTANASSGQPSVTVASGQGARFLAGQLITVYGGLFANGGNPATNAAGADSNKHDQLMTVQSITAGGGSGGGDLVTFTTNLANTYTAQAGTVTDGFGPIAAYGAYLTFYQTGNNNSVAGRTLGNEDQQNGLHLLNCQRFHVSGITARNLWESPVKCGTGFGANPLGDACGYGTITRCTGYHAYDQGISIWLSPHITVADNVMNSTGWACVSFSGSDRCTAKGNQCINPVYRVAGDNNSGTGIAIEGGEGNLVVGNQCDGAWSNSVRLSSSPLAFGVNTGSPPTLGAGISAGLTAGSSVQMSATGALQAGGQYCLIDAERTEKLTVATIVDGTHVTFDRPIRFPHASGVPLTVAVAIDNVLEGNSFRNSQLGAAIAAQGGARNIIRNNDMIGAGVASALNPFAQGVNLGDASIGSATIGGEGTVISGNTIGATSNEGVYLNTVTRVVVEGNTISESLNGFSACINETGTSDFNRIEGNRCDPQTANQIQWTGQHTVVRNNSGKRASFLELQIALDNPQAWWKLDDSIGSSTAADFTGNGHTGTATNVTFGSQGATSENPGSTGARFNGTSSTITTTYNPALTAVTVETFVSYGAPGVQGGGEPRFMANSHTDADFKGFEFTFANDTQPKIYFGNGTVVASVTCATAVSPGMHHVVGTWDGTTVRLYVDGYQAGTTALAGSMPAGAATGIGIGFNPTYTGDYLNGSMAQAVVYNSVLSATRIMAHYLAALNG